MSGEYTNVYKGVEPGVSGQKCTTRHRLFIQQDGRLLLCVINGALGDLKEVK